MVSRVDSTELERNHTCVQSAAFQEAAYILAIFFILSSSGDFITADMIN
jgi:hypothetical protein